MDIPIIQREWSALGGAYDIESWQLPLPLWAQRAYTDSGPRTWFAGNMISEIKSHVQAAADWPRRQAAGWGPRSLKV